MSLKNDSRSRNSWKRVLTRKVAFSPWVKFSNSAFEVTLNISKSCYNLKLRHKTISVKLILWKQCGPYILWPCFIHFFFRSRSSNFFSILGHPRSKNIHHKSSFSLLVHVPSKVSEFLRLLLLLSVRRTWVLRFIPWRQYKFLFVCDIRRDLRLQ